MTYKLATKLVEADSQGFVIFSKDSVERWIPFDPDNTDYQKYLEWLAEGNEPLPADEP